jgi:3-methyl-2-oxobutanoate hydroxymethyltransferase
VAQVIYGLPSTLAITLETMIAHGAAVVRGSRRCLVVVDLPFGTYERSPEQAFENAARLLQQTGAGAVKLEGGTAMATTVRFLVDRGISVMGHVGLTPQAINRLGGYGARGKDEADYRAILGDAIAIAEAGAFAIVIEAVVEGLAQEITIQVRCPTIGIGASAECDGQVLVVDDMLGMFDKTARFVERFETLAERISAAAERYASDVRSRAFPAARHLYRAGS